MMKYQSFARTDVGTVRTVNEDAVFMEPRLGLFLVCDGCGGHRAGDVASRLAVETVHEAVLGEVEALKSYVKAPTRRKRIKTMEAVVSAVEAASAKVHAEATSDPARAGMGTTIVLLQLLGDQAIVAHVGDSRGYLFRRGQLFRLTEDHTLANQYVRMGVLSAEKARQSRSAQMITRAIGQHEHVRVDALHMELVSGDVFLLCTDGLTMHVSDPELAKACEKLDPEQLCRQLVDTANRRGGQDNASVVIVRVQPGQRPEDDETVRRTQALQRVPLFRHLSFAELLRVLDICQVETYGAGNRILAEGSRGERIYVTVAGAVHVLKNHRKLAELPPGSLFGEMCLIDDAPRSADVIAPDGARVLSLDRNELLALLRQERTLAVKVLWGLSFLLNSRLRATSEKLSATSAAQQAAIAQTRTKSDELPDASRPFV
ncbi:MAG TPA: cyclic nucleotide-binding domain-containing protein [Phycisphaerae bacterium]|nr:cyclic nucleotide-binding domain-containing protein [Phycisphaerae bacterium]